jgi:hypothetical protein
MHCNELESVAARNEGGFVCVRESDPKHVVTAETLEN